MKNWLLVLAAASLVVLSCRAGADAGPKISSGWYLPVGLTLGGSMHADRPNGFVLGAEVSAAHVDVDSGFWYGAYLDALWDFGPDALRFSLGPEIGVGVVGLDGGYLAEIHGRTYKHGFQLRLLLTFSIVAVYGRWGHLFRHPREEDFGELGVLIKFPVPVKIEPVKWHRPPQPAAHGMES
ncbi:MAG: hypothetical protein JRG91_03670 [Deltaproteobacteria bacterium]|nr:hypothetical protein [Deltaproteobacteria bacterium]